MTGTGSLLRLILRRDRLLMPLWVVIIGLLPLLYVGLINDVMPTDAARADYARVSGSSAGFVGLYGPLHGATIGELVAWRSGFLTVMIGLFSLLTVVRHTRADEESGRTELVGSGVVGRHAGLAAALITTVAAALTLGAIATGTLLALNLPPTGSILLGAQLTLAGAIFAAVGAVTAQLATGARTARTLGLVTLGVTFLLRFAGDTSPGASWLSWLSPIGWVQRLFPYGKNSWTPALPALALAATLIAAAAILATRRDVGAGLVAERPGPATAAATLSGPLGLAWRLHRGALLGWTAGLAVLGLLFGGVARSASDLVAENPDLARLFEGLGGASALTDSFLAGMIALLGLFAAAYAIQATLRLREEEATSHAELVLAAGVSRGRYLASHLVFALLGPAVALLIGGATCGLVAGLALNDVSGRLPSVLAGAAAQIPAVWVLATLTALLFGVLPRQAGLGWGAFAICFLLLVLGASLGLSPWILDISPFTHVPHLPGGHATAKPFIALTATALTLTLAAFLTYRRRGVPSL
jgi:ABC-2 type transport system permease protein